MEQRFYSAFQHAPYPCYWLGRDGEFWTNDAAAAPDAVPPAIVRGQLAAALNGAGPANTAMLADALRIQGFSMLPLEDGVFASATERREAPITAFSTQIREPLTNIYAVLPLLAKNLEPEDAVYAEVIQRNCYSMLRLACNMENAGRLEQHRFELRTLDLGVLVDSVCFCVRSVCKAQGIPLLVSVPEDPVLVRGDTTLLTEGLLNLIRNSMQFTQDGNEIHVKLYTAGGRAVLTVADKGMGIKPENLPYIFEPYFSIEPYGEDALKPGLGLGLSVTQQAATSFGGTATAESRFGEGTRITLALPLTEGEADVLASDPADYLLNRYSPVYIQLAGYCRLPLL